MPRLPVIALALALGLSVVACKQGTPPPPGNIAERLKLPTLAGETFDPATLAGKPAVVMFWRPSCPHCLAELPDLIKACKDKDVPAVAVLVTRDAPAAQKVLADHGFTGAALADDGTVRTALGIKAVPYTLVLRGNGTAESAFIGRQSYETIASAIADAR